MIVCNLCGQAVSGLGDLCTNCSGKGVERNSPFKSLLTPTQRRGSPDRWAQSYTTPPRSSSGSPLARDASQVENAPSKFPGQHRQPDHLDIQQAPGSELARVYGSLVDKVESHPLCTACGTKLVSGRKIYLPRTPLVNSKDAFCRPCYSSRFSLGTCRACQSAVVGDEEEPHHGDHVRGRGASIWHAGCFRCEACDLALYEQDHLLAVSGEPRCLSCYSSTQRTASPALLRPLRRFAPPGSVLGRQGSSTNLPDPPSDSSRTQTTTSIDKRIHPESMPRTQYRSSVRHLAERFEQTQEKRDTSMTRKPTNVSDALSNPFVTKDISRG